MRIMRIKSNYEIRRFVITSPNIDRLSHYFTRAYRMKPRKYDKVI